MDCESHPEGQDGHLPLLATHRLVERFHEAAGYVPGFASILQAMPTLYVRDVPSELYERLRREAVSARRSLSAETIELLRRSLFIRTGVSLEQLLQDADRIRANHNRSAGSPTAAELIREDRDR